MIRRCQPLLGTFVEMTLDGASDKALHQVVGKAFQLIACVQKLMGFHDCDSDVSRLNRCAHVAPLRVHPWTMHVIECALTLSRETDGAFDITVAPQLVKWGYLPDHAAAGTQPHVGRWQQIELLPDCHIRFHGSLQIDLGGIAKGFAVDKAIEWLATRGINHATVNAGGDLRVLGHSGPPLVIRDPVRPQAIHHSAEMLRPAAATSASYFARKNVGSGQVVPILHPRSGRPLKNNASVTVFSPTCLEADALTKVVLLSPQKVWQQVLRQRDSLALMVRANGERTILPA